MTADPMTAEPEMTFEDAAQVTLDNGFRQLPVVDGSNVLGVASLRRVLGGRGSRRPKRPSLAAERPQAEAFKGSV